jgi:hypothetical protein
MTEEAPARPSLLRRALAFLVLMVAIWIGLHLLIGLVMSIVWIVIGAAVIAAVFWALKTLIW